MQLNSNILRLSTEDFPERDRVAIFREQFGRGLFRLDIEPLPDKTFRSTTTIRQLPGAVITSNIGGGARQWRTPELLADGRDDFLMIMNLRGPSVVGQRGEEIVLASQSATLGTLSELGGIIRPQTNHRLLIVNMPRAVIGPLVPRADDALLRPIAPDCAALRLLIEYAGALLGIDLPLQVELQRSIVDHIYDLVVAAIGGTRDAVARAKGRGIPAARLGAIKADILQNLLKRDLSIGDVCAQHGISQRYLRMLFAGEQTTFSDFVVDRRLALARRRLGDPARLELAISAVAYQCGFGDLSYFNRVFRRHFGITPSEARAEAHRPIRGQQRTD